MTQTCVSSDDNNWENNVFSETEIRELQETWQEVLYEHQPQEPTVLMGAIGVPMPLVAETLKLIWKAYLNESEPFSNFLYGIGTSLAAAYMYDSEIEYDEAITEIATYFIEPTEEEIDETDDDDEQDDDIDED